MRQKKRRFSHEKINRILGWAMIALLALLALWASRGPLTRRATSQPGFSEALQREREPGALRRK